MLDYIHSFGAKSVEYMYEVLVGLPSAFRWESVSGPFQIEKLGGADPVM